MVYKETGILPISHNWDIQAEDHQGRNLIKYTVFQYDRVK